MIASTLIRSVYSLAICFVSLCYNLRAWAEVGVVNTPREASSRATSWNPAHTWAFVVGILEWKDSESFAPFPKDDRRDARLVQVLKDKGVPTSQIIYLQDHKATIGAVQRELPKFLQRASVGDWVIVYFAGHGYKVDSGEAFLATYDASDKTPGWRMRSVPEVIDQNFQGSHALIALDNCYSGAMAELVTHRPRSVSYGVFASSQASALSTANWTFTESLLATMAGTPAADANHDGQVTFSEAGAYIESEILFAEEQVAITKFSSNFDRELIVAKTMQGAGSRIGEHVEAFTANEWYKGVIVDSKTSAFKIHFYGYGASEDEWIDAKNIRRATLVQYKKGTSVEVKWQKSWYPATIIDVRDGSHLITYKGFDSTWDEWVPSARIRSTSTATTGDSIGDN